MNTQQSTRPISTGHLVFGLVFTGIAVIWLVGELTDVEAPGFAWWGPAVLIGAGVVGLVASFAGTRRRTRPAAPAEPVATAEPAEYADTEPAAPVEPVEPAGPARSTEPVAAAEATESVEPTENTEPVEAVVPESESTVVLPDADDSEEER